jgi:hypothetical protein
MVKVCLIVDMAIERCTKPHALTAETIVKFHLSLQKAEMFIVESVIESIENGNSIFSEFWLQPKPKFLTYRVMSSFFLFF